MVKGMLLASLAAFSWGAAIVANKKGTEEPDAGGVFFRQICNAVILSWIVLFIKKKKLLLNSKVILTYAADVFGPFLAYTLTLYRFYPVSARNVSTIFSLESMFVLVLSVLIYSVKINSPQYLILFLIGAIVGDILVTLSDINNGSNNIIGCCLVVTGMSPAAFYVAISPRLVKSLELIALLSGQLIFSLILSSLFVSISKSSTYFPLEPVIIVFSFGILQYFLAFYFYLNFLR